MRKAQEIWGLSRSANFSLLGISQIAIRIKKYTTYNNKEAFVRLHMRNPPTPTHYPTYRKNAFLGIG